MKWISIFVLMCILTSKSFGQDIATFTVQIPIKLRQTGATIALMVDSKTFFTVLSQANETAIFKIPIMDSAAKISVKYFNIGYEAPEWKGDFKFIGSEKAEVLLQESGNLSIKQWPKVEFEASSSKAEIKVNGESWGDTFLSRTVQPDKDHLIQWIKQGKVTCSKTIKLTYNQKRRFTCNSDNTITED